MEHNYLLQLVEQGGADQVGGGHQEQPAQVAGDADGVAEQDPYCAQSVDYQHPQ